MMGMLRRSPNSASGRVRVKPRSANGKRSLARDDRGQSIVEFALVSTFLVLPLVVGIVVFGIAFNRQIILTNAVNNAAMQAGLSRQSSPTDVCNVVNAAVASSASPLNTPSNPLTFSILVAGSAIDSATTGKPISTNVAVAFGGSTVGACPVQLSQNQALSVSLSYGCNLTVFGTNYAPTCNLTAQTAEAVQ